MCFSKQFYYYFAVEKVDTLKRYKFSLAFENSNEEDYVTEKFFQSLVAGKSYCFVYRYFIPYAYAGSCNLLLYLGLIVLVKYLSVCTGLHLHMYVRVYVNVLKGEWRV